MRIGRSGTFPPFQDLHLARLGALAPSRHNTQPWKFSIDEHTIRVCPDFTRRLPAADPADRSLYLSLGCVTENIVLAAGLYGFDTEVEESADESVRIRLSHSEHHQTSTPELVSVMALRQCNRHPFTGAAISTRRMRKLTHASRQPGVEFGVVTDPYKIASVTEVLGKGGKERRPAVTAELAHWTRFSRREAEFRRDGLLFTGMGYPPMPRFVGYRFVAALVRTNRQNERSASLARSASALAVFAPRKDNQAHWFNLGRSFQRVVLTAASLGIRYAHLQLPYAAPASEDDLRWCFGLNTRQPFLAVRLGYFAVVPHSLRRPLSHLLIPSSGDHRGAEPARPQADRQREVTREPVAR